MIKFLIYILLFIPCILVAQLKEEDKTTIDALQQTINIAKHDSDIVNAYFDWDAIIYVSDIKLDIELNEKIEKICSKNLNKKLNKKEKEFFLNMQSSSFNNLGSISRNKGDYEKAINYYNKSLKIAQKINDKSAEANVLNNIGIVRDNQGETIIALKYYKKSLKIRTELGEETGNMVSTLDNIGTVYAGLGNYNQSILHLSKALKIAEKIDDKSDIAHIMLGIGSNYANFEEYNKAIDYYEKSMKIAKKIGSKSLVSTNFLRMGNVYSSQDKNEKALEYYNSALAISEEIGYVSNIAACINNIGTIYKSRGEFDKALAYFNRSYNLEEKTGNTIGMSGSLNGIAMVYSEKGNNAKALEYFKKALKYSEEAGYVSFSRNISFNIYDVYKTMGNNAKALETYEKYIVLRDSVKGVESQKELIKLEYEKQKTVDVLKNDKLIAIEKEEKQKQKVISYAIAGALGLTTMFFFFVFNRLKVTRQQKNVIEEQKSIVENQKEEVEEQRDIANEQKLILEEKNKEILDSITYAKRIQEAILPPPRLVKEWLTESFIFYKPKDIVAGDFYWMETSTYQENGKDKTLVYFAAADCTGHGVPGAMVSVVCANALNRAIKEFNLIEPGQVLDKVSELVVESFDKGDEEIKDGMDIALCALDISAKKIYYSGANNPLYHITAKDNKVDGDYRVELGETHQLIEYKANKQPVGQYDNRIAFQTLEIQLEPGDAIYVFSDGFADQFGGEKGKKYKYSSFRKCLLDNFNHPMETQKQMLNDEFENWKGNLEQIDDVCVIGVKINGVEKNNFTKRELEVLLHLQEGLPSKLIADKMFISKHTVDTYRRRLLAKTGTYNSTELINYCIKKEII
jgi:tetratricopeptide (TPR) repeat protein/DNA-binding CsgD family transcriptional regulator